ncbi:MAG: aldo/keto reductase [Verrucomicrobiae bacterium]|nr:aldo/keto reductase [Verrucomicrobiae bacterium]
MSLKRREFLKRSALSLTGLVVGTRLLPAAESRAAHFDPFERVPLGRTGLKVSRICLGTGMRGWMRESNQTRLGREAFEKLIRGAFERGVNLFDLADLYGSHPFVPGALKGIPRDRYVLISKIWWRENGLPEQERPDADVIVTRFLKELQTDYVDLVLLHCVTSAKWPEELARQMEILEGLKKKGAIRAHGVSCHSIEALEAAARHPWVQSVNTRINPYGVKMDGPPEKVVPVLKEIHAAGKGVVGMKIIGEGEFRDSEEKRDASVQFALHLGCVDTLCVGCESLAELDDLAARIRKVPRPARAAS